MPDLPLEFCSADSADHGLQILRLERLQEQTPGRPVTDGRAAHFRAPGKQAKDQVFPRTPVIRLSAADEKTGPLTILHSRSLSLELLMILLRSFQNGACSHDFCRSCH